MCLSVKTWWGCLHGTRQRCKFIPSRYISDPLNNLLLTSVDGEEKCLNVYDVRLYDDMPACGMNWPPDLPDVTTYLGVSLPNPTNVIDS